MLATRIGLRPIAGRESVMVSRLRSWVAHHRALSIRGSRRRSRRRGSRRLGERVGVGRILEIREICGWSSGREVAAFDNL